VTIWDLIQKHASNVRLNAKNDSRNRIQVDNHRHNTKTPHRRF
jgi:hypothetical protein